MILIETFLAKPIVEEVSREKLPDGVLCRVSYPICNIGERNANGRVYEAAVWDKVMEEADLKEKLENRALFGHAEHPEQTQSNLEKTSHVIFEMWKDDGKVWQKIDILDTPTGRVVDCLLKSCRVGVSTRAEGDLEEAEDDQGTYQRVVPESYNFVTTDFTADPSTFGVMPHDIKRNVVSEVRKLLEDKKSDAGEKEFATCLLESMRCKKSMKSHKCHKCGACETLGEKKALSSLIKEGVIEVHTKLKYGDVAYKVDTVVLDESVSCITISPDVENREVRIDQDAVRVDGDPYVAIDKDGTIHIMPVEQSIDEPAKQPPPIEPPAVEPGTADAEIVGDSDEPGNTGFGLPAVDGVEDEMPEAVAKGLSPHCSPHTEEGSRNENIEVGATVQFDQIAEGKCGVILTGADIGQKERKPKYFDTEDEAKEYAKRMNRQLSQGEKDYYKLRYKTVEGKVTAVKEGAISIALDDGTVVNIEDPTAVCITVMAPAPAEEVEPVAEPEFPPEEETIPPEEEFESKVKEGKLHAEGGVSDQVAAGNLLRDKDGKDWTVRSADDALVVTQPGEPGTEKRIEWSAVGSYGFTKVSEVKVDEIVTNEVKLWGHLWLKDGQEVNLQGEDPSKLNINPDDIVHFGEHEIGKEAGVFDSEANKVYNTLATVKKLFTKVEEAKSVEKDDGWHVESPSGEDLGGPYGSKVEADKRKKKVEFYAASKESKLDETEDIKAMYRAADLPVPDGKGIHTKAFHELAIDVAKGYVDDVGKEEAMRRGYATAMDRLGKEKAVKKPHQRSEAKVDEDFEKFEGKGIEIGDIIQVMDLEGNTTVVPKATVHAIDEALGDDGEMHLTVETTGSANEDEQQWYREDQYDIVLLRKANESQEVDEGFQTDLKNKDKGAISKRLSDITDKLLKGESLSGPEKTYWNAYHAAVSKQKKESISNIVKEIQDLKIEEASTRAERDKAIELLEELTNEQGEQLDGKARKEKAFEVKVLVSKIEKTLEGKEKEVDALRAKLEERVKLAAEVKAKLSDELKNLKESISVEEQKHQIEADALMEHLQKTTDTHIDQMNAFGKQREVTEAKHQKELESLTRKNEGKLKRIKEEVEEKVRAEVTKEFVKRFIEFKLSEMGLQIDENSQALLEKCKSLDEAEDLLDEVLDAGRRSALHSESLTSIRVVKHEVRDPELEEAKTRVKDSFDGMGM